jgi:hypothetical protein
VGGRMRSSPERQSVIANFAKGLDGWSRRREGAVIPV